VGAALVLLAAGVGRTEIIQDYGLSTRYLGNRMSMIAESLHALGADPEPVMARLLRHDNLEGMLDIIDQEFGGIDGYLSRIGVTDMELATFRQTFVEE
jgi:protein tyrosine/serine phosphatase